MFSTNVNTLDCIMHTIVPSVLFQSFWLRHSGSPTQSQCPLFYSSLFSSIVRIAICLMRILIIIVPLYHEHHFVIRQFDFLLQTVLMWSALTAPAAMVCLKPQSNIAHPLIGFFIALSNQTITNGTSDIFSLILEWSRTPKALI